MKKREIINAVDDSIGKDLYQFWYVGISNDFEKRLNEYNVTPKVNSNIIWIALQADNNDIAREVEAHFIALGCVGGPGEG